MFKRIGATRWRIGLGVVALLVLLFAFFLASMHLVEFTDSTAFCSTCHNMYPEVTVYHASPHARTECGTCHVGPGALAFVQAKLQNVRYLWIYPLNLYPRPIPSPIESLRPVEIVCEQCHWPQKFYDDRLLTVSDYASDEKNSLTRTNLLLKTGGGLQTEGRGRGIHWHIENPVYYIATDDKRQEIPWVQAEFNGQVTEYISVDSQLTPEQIAGAEKRRMDCVDCHNRATHVFRQPDDALNAAMAQGNIPADLPFIKEQGMAVLSKVYATEAEAEQAAVAVGDWYRTNHPDVASARDADVKKAVAGLQALVGRTQFPFMKVNWDTHPDNIGHQDTPGCFRCHDGKHLSQDNQAVRLECNVCHSIPQQAGPGEPLPAVSFPAMPEPESHRSTTWLAQHRFKFDASCEGCHTTENPGGDDNSSFCSNGACHGAEWRFVGLNAPRIRELSEPPRQPSSGQPNPIPHPVTQRTDCNICHRPEGVLPMPPNHSGFTRDMCTSCHKPTLEETAAPAATATPGPAAVPSETPASTPAAGTPPAIPHDITGREDCLVCHNPDGGIKPAPADHKGRPSSTCQGCHQPAAGAPAGATAEATPVAAATANATAVAAPTAAAAPAAGGIPSIPHAVAGQESCLACHNPDGGLKPAPADHAGRPVESCQACHKPA